MNLHREDEPTNSQPGQQHAGRARTAANDGRPPSRRRTGGEQADGSPPALTSARAVIAVTFLSWLGLIIHNAAEQPQIPLLGPATTIPTGIYVLLAVLYWRPGPPLASWLLLGWGWLQAIGGGILSVLPLPFLPFHPPQTLSHYSVHAVYALFQVPLLIVLTRQIRDTSIRKQARQA
jgi:hypothetical protein